MNKIAVKYKPDFDDSYKTTLEYEKPGEQSTDIESEIYNRASGSRKKKPYAK